MNLLDNRVCVWVARVTVGEQIEISAWSGRDKAIDWVEWTVEDDGIEWREPQGDSGRDLVFGHVDGVEVAEVRCVELQDPVSLANRYPSELPAARYIPGNR